MAGITKDTARFFVVGINYKKSDARVRGQFAVNDQQYEAILELAKQKDISELFVLSTCNRTELYGVADSAADLEALLCTQTAGDLSLFREMRYAWSCQQAMNHLFRVGAGLDSQILGDYEIVGQLKNAVKFAKNRGFVGTFLERLVNQVLSSSKEVKNSTALSGGTVSVSFAAVQYLRNLGEHHLFGKKILLLGTGKIGRNTCKNLVDYLPPTSITLMNRTFEKAQQLATETGLKASPIEELSEVAEAADIILVATNSGTPAVLPHHVQGKGPKIIIDLSIPHNVDPSVGNIEGIQLINVDELSRLKDETLQRRQQEVPKALAIIAAHQQEFTEWVGMRQHVPVLKAVKEKLMEIQENPALLKCPHAQLQVTNEGKDKIQKVINVMATKMRKENSKGCHYIEAINDFISSSAN